MTTPDEERAGAMQIAVSMADMLLPRTAHDHRANAVIAAAKKIAEALSAARREERAQGEGALAALGAMRTWLGVVADKLDLDADDTKVTINAVGPNGSREVAARSLRSIYEQADKALATAAASAIRSPDGRGGRNGTVTAS